mgnify:CR=1 FL=1
MPAPASSVPALPEDIWVKIRGHLCRCADVHINMEDGVHEVTFLTRVGFRRGNSFFVQLDELPPVDDGGYSGQWDNYYRFLLFRRSDGFLKLAPVTTEVTTKCPKPLWAVIGQVSHVRVPRFHGHAISAMFRDYVSTQAVLSCETLAALKEYRFPNAFVTVTETAFPTRGTGESPFDMSYKFTLQDT